MTLPSRRNPGQARPRRSVWDPYTEFDRINREMAQLFDDAWTQPSLRDGGFVPMADIEETDDAFLVEIEVPGVDRDDIDIELTGRTLSVSGERKEKERTGILRKKTRVTGRFAYEVSFPGDLDDDGVSASYEDGVLTVRVPKAEQEKARKIQIR